jgi:hypothetical protein
VHLESESQLAERARPRIALRRRVG